MPHSSQGFIDLRHNLRRLPAPTELEKLLPHMTCVPMNNRFWNSAKKLMNHDSLVFFWDTVKSLLNYVTSEWVHAETQRVALDGVGYGNDLLRSSMLEAALNKKVAKTINHERVRLMCDGFDDIIFLFSCSNFELLLKKDRGLLIVVADNFVHYIFPVARNIFIKKSTVVEWFKRRDICLQSVCADLCALAEERRLQEYCRWKLTGDVVQGTAFVLVEVNSFAVGESEVPIGLWYGGIGYKPTC